VIDLNDVKYFKTSNKGKECFSKKYMSYCVKCEGPRGYIFKSEDGKMCKKCTKPSRIENLNKSGHIGVKKSADIRKGKPSPLKGVKTGKPAWNSKNLSKEHKLLRNRISRRLRHSLSNRGLSKNWISVFNILNLSIEDLKKHIESQFQPGMSWENYGEWHIDHVIPDSWFNYSSTDDIHLYMTKTLKKAGH
jgi:hypothetical protein